MNSVIGLLSIMPCFLVLTKYYERNLHPAFLRAPLNTRKGRKYKIAGKTGDRHPASITMIPLTLYEAESQISCQQTLLNHLLHIFKSITYWSESEYCEYNSFMETVIWVAATAPFENA